MQNSLAQWLIQRKLIERDDDNLMKKQKVKVPHVASQTRTRV